MTAKPSRIAHLRTGDNQSLRAGDQVRITAHDDDGDFQATMTVTDPPNATGFVGVGFGHTGIRFMWVAPRQIRP